MADIKEMIKKAGELYALYGDGICSNQTISTKLQRYKEDILRTNLLMRRTDIVSTCSDCARDGSGSCCMQEVEQWYDPILLMINLLMGVEISDSHEIAGHCIFLGAKGCKLSARYAFCVNYLCPALKKLLNPTGARVFMSTAGKELYSGWEAEQSVRRWFRDSKNINY